MKKEPREGEEAVAIREQVNGEKVVQNMSLQWKQDDGRARGNQEMWPGECGLIPTSHQCVI